MTARKLATAAAFAVLLAVFALAVTLSARPEPSVGCVRLTSADGQFKPDPAALAAYKRGVPQCADDARWMSEARKRP